MKKLTSLAMAFALTGVAGSAFAGTSTDNSIAGALHSSTTVHFNGLVEPATCSFQGKSVKVTLPTVNVSNFAGLKHDEPYTPANKDFQLNVKCDEGFTSDRILMKISGNSNNGHILENTNGTAKGIGLAFVTPGGVDLPIGQTVASSVVGLAGANGLSNNIKLTAEYVRDSGDVTSGNLVTDAVFELSYK